MVRESPSTPNTIQSVIANGFSWINVERPSHADVDELVRGRDFLRSDVEMALDRRQPPGILHRERYLLILVHVPLPPASGQHQTSLISPVAIFVRSETLLTVHTGEIRPLTRFFQQLVSDEESRDAAFAVGIGGVLFAILQRLVDATAAARARLDHAISVLEEELPRSDASETIAAAMKRQREARLLRRLVVPLPELIRGLEGIDLGLTARDDWERLALRCDHLVEAIGDDVEALRGLWRVMDVASSLRRTTHLRALTAVAATALPVIVVATLLAMPPANPLANQPNGFAMSLAVAGAVFLGALVVLKRRGIV